MHFAYPLHWWLALVLAAAVGTAAFLEYRRPLSPLTPPQRAVLAGLRAALLAALVLFLFRPIVFLPPAGSRDALVPVLIDAARSAKAGGLAGPPVYAIGVGSPDGPRDREVVGLVAGDPRLDQAKIDLHVTAFSSGFGRTPFAVRVMANGQVMETRRLVPVADGSPIDEVFTV